MDTIKDRNCKDLREAEEIENIQKKYTEELYKKDLNDPDNLIGVVCHLEPDILECEVKWDIGSTAVNKAEINISLVLSSFFDDPADVGNLISGPSAFSKTSLNIWNFTVHVLIKPGLENFILFL